MSQDFRNRIFRGLGLTSAGALAAVALLAAPASPGAGPAPAAPPLAFRTNARPVLESACFKCHGPEKKKGHVDFSTFADDHAAGRAKKLWRKAIELVESGEMPPEDEKPLAPEQREKLLRWMKQAASAECPAMADRDPGPAPIRRLNRAEYNNTVRDLLGVEFDAGAAVGMPDDQPVQGYSTLANALSVPPALMEKYFAAADKVLDDLLPPPGAKPPEGKSAAARKKLQQARDALLFAKLGDGVSPRDAARKIAEKFAPRAYRRPAKPEEIDRLLKLFDLAAGRGEAFEPSVRLMLKGLLVSPHFLFRVEQDRAPQGSDKVYAVGDYELATRLSYFLWSSMPDDELFALAAANKLSEPAELERQVKRMLADPKARALTDDFAAQWLQTRKVETARPSTEFFPTFTPKLRQAMYDESATFFDHLRTDDRSILDLLDADYTYANEDLAKHYGLPDVKGPEMRKVALRPADHRGGLLGMGAVLASTSHTYRTSPTLRGKYVLEVVFGTPPPPPPANAGMFKDESKVKEAKSFREKLAQHAADPTCASCHKRIDPLGFGLENFDAVGRWRADAGGQPLDNSGRLVTGEEFTGSDALKQIILQRKDEFVSNLVGQMLTYAVGREPDGDDECVVKETKAALEKDGYRFSTLVLGVVKSRPFLYRRNSDSP